MVQPFLAASVPNLFLTIVNFENVRSQEQVVTGMVVNILR